MSNLSASSLARVTPSASGRVSLPPRGGPLPLPAALPRSCARLRSAALALASLALALVAWLLRDARDGLLVGCLRLGWVAVACALWLSLARWLCGPSASEGGAS